MNSGLRPGDCQIPREASKVSRPSDDNLVEKPPSKENSLYDAVAGSMVHTGSSRSCTATGGSYPEGVGKG